MDLSVTRVYVHVERWNMRHDTPLHPGINFSKLPVSGSAGLLFTVGTMAIFLITLPEIRWFFVRSLPAGILVGAALTYIHRR